MQTVYKKQEACFIFKNDLFEIKNQMYNLRKNNLDIPFINTKKVTMSFIQIGLRDLNMIIQKKKMLVYNNYSYFRLKLKKWFYSNL